MADSIPLEKRIADQVDYYFSDHNLYRDKHLTKLISEDAEGWVPLKDLLTFNRLNALSQDPKVVADAVKTSDKNLVQVSEDGEKLRRNPERVLKPRNEEVRKEMLTKQAYVKGFPLDATLDECITFFKQYNVVENVIMRKRPDKDTKKQVFKGSVFATFDTVENCDKFLALKEVKYKDVVLICMKSQDYSEKKRKERIDRSAKKDSGPEIESKIKLPKGATLHMTGLGETATREKIRDVLEEIEGKQFITAFLEYEKGGAEGYVRLKEENAAIELFKKMTDGKITVEDKEITVRVLEGEEEETYLKEQCQNIRKNRDSAKNKTKNKRQGWKHPQKNKKRKYDNDEDGVKKQKTVVADGNKKEVTAE